MTEREIDIADMQCWVFRIAQTRWHISPIECAELFKKYDILGYISECYDLLCTYSYSLYPPFHVERAEPPPCPRFVYLLTLPGRC